MPLPGGAADKLGNLYELKWVVYQLIRLLENELDWIEFEPVGLDGELIEFVIQLKDGSQEAHQVKRQRGNKGYWIISDLKNENVLKGMRFHVLSRQRKFAFVSSDGVKSMRELSERAVKAGNLEAFKNYFLSKELAEEFYSYAKKIELEEEEAWLVLKNSKFINPGTDEIFTRNIYSLLEKLLTGDCKTSCLVLASFAYENIHRRITSTELWNVLESENITPNNFVSDSNLIFKLREETKAYLSSQSLKIVGQQIMRRESEDVIRIFRDKESPSQFVFLTGKAGAGKTGVAAQVIEKLQSNGWPVLAFRLDRLDPTQRVDKLGEQILGRKKSPVALLAGAANGNECLLVIDQLDAVSVTSGRNMEFFNPVSQMIRETEFYPNMRVLIVCREFDLKNDNRFRPLEVSLRDRSVNISVAIFQSEEVDRILYHLNIAPNSLPEKQRRLLQTPSLLSMFADVVGMGNNSPLSFTTEKELFDEFWEHIKSKIELSDQNLFSSILKRITDKMNEKASLSIPVGGLREWESDISKFISVNLLVRQGRKIAFFHESFLDYLTARFFTEDGESLFLYLRGHEQSLFLRAQVRQILVFLRDNDFEEYLRELENILSSQDIRFHIKKLTLSVVGQVVNPREEEWKILDACFFSQESGIANSARSAISLSAEWFELLYDKGILLKWLEEKSTESDYVFNFSRSISSKIPKTVAELFRRIARKDDETDKKILLMITWSGDKAIPSELEKVLYHIVDNSTRTWEFRSGCYEKLIDDVAYRDAKAGCRALGRYIEYLSLLPEKNHPLVNRYDKPDLPSGDIQKLAETEPLVFVKSVLNPTLVLMEKFAVIQGTPPYKERIDYALYEKHYPGINHSLRGLVEAMIKTSELSTKLYHKTLGVLMRSNTRWAHLTLLKVLKNKNIAKRAGGYIVRHWNNHDIWYESVGLWDARCLLQHIGENIPKKLLKKIEKLILGHYESFTMRDSSYFNKREQAYGHRWRTGLRQFTLLSALPEQRLSKSAKKRLCELSRKSKALGWKLEHPYKISGGTVVSPLSSEVIKKMTDKQWLSAIETYDDTEREKYLEDKILGGASELSRMLEKQAEEAPVRFAKLMLNFPNDTDHHYFNAVARGIRGGNLDIELLKSVVAKAQKHCGPQNGNLIVGLIAGHRKEVLPDSLLDTVRKCAVEDPDPQEEMWKQDTGGGQTYYGGSIFNYGINTVRGYAALDIARMLESDERYWEFFLPALEIMVNDPSVAVRSCVAEACAQGLRYNRKKSISLFIKLCQIEEDKLLGSQTVKHFLRYTWDSEFEYIRDILKRMIRSSEDEVREIGAVRVCVMALKLKKAHPLMEEAIKGDEALRKGAAKVFAQNLMSAPYRDICVKNLIPLFDDPSKEVRREAARWHYDSKMPEEREDILPIAEAYIESRAFLDNPDRFIRSLNKAADIHPQLIFSAVKRFVEYAGEKAGDLRSRFATVGKEASELILRAYRQAGKDTDLRKECLDSLDELLAVEAYGVLDAIESIER